MRLNPVQIVSSDLDNDTRLISYWYKLQTSSLIYFIY